MSLVPPRSLLFDIHLDWEVRAHPREGPRVSQVWKKKPDNWLKINRDPEELTYRNDLTTSFLLTKGDAHTFSLGVNLCLASFLTKQFLCVLSHLLLSYFFYHKTAPAFTVSASMINAFFTGGKDTGGKKSSSLWPLMVCWLGFLVLIQAESERKC